MERRRGCEICVEVVEVGGVGATGGARVWLR